MYIVAAAETDIGGIGGCGTTLLSCFRAGARRMASKTSDACFTLLLPGRRMKQPLRIRRATGPGIRDSPRYFCLRWTRNISGRSRHALSKRGLRKKGEHILNFLERRDRRTKNTHTIGS